MQINLSEELLSQTLLSHVVLHGLTFAVDQELCEKVAEQGQSENGVLVDLVLTANGQELNLESFVKHWQAQVRDMIKKEAANLVNNKLVDITDLAADLQKRLEEEINKRLEEWETPYDSVLDKAKGA